MAISERIKYLYKYHHDDSKTQPKLTDLVEALKLEITRFSKVIIVVDALDECLERNQEILIQTLQSLTCVVNLIVISYFLPSIQLQFMCENILKIESLVSVS